MTRISEVRLGCVEYGRGRPPVRFAGHVFRYAALVACVRCEDGTSGLGIAWARLEDEIGYARSGLPTIAEALIGQDGELPFETGRLVQERAHRPGLARLANVTELALWDLAGRLQEVPVADLLGRKHRALPAYAISADEFGFTSIDQYLALVSDFAARGFRACKLHLFGTAERDIEACREIRAAVGEGMVLMLDPAGRYRPRDALKVGRAIAELGFVRLEDPLAPDDRAGYRWLSPRIDVPIAVNDSLRWTSHECLDAIQAGILQCVRMDPGRAGMAQALRMAAVADAAGAEFDVSAFAPVGGVEASLHLSLASSASRWFEHHEAAGLDEVPGLATGISIVDGVARASDAPGLGATIDWAELDRHGDWAG